MSVNWFSTANSMLSGSVEVTTEHVTVTTDPTSASTASAGLISTSERGDYRGRVSVQFNNFSGCYFTQKGIKHFGVIRIKVATISSLTYHNTRVWCCPLHTPPPVYLDNFRLKGNKILLVIVTICLSFKKIIQ